MSRVAMFVVLVSPDDVDPDLAEHIMRNSLNANGVRAAIARQPDVDLGAGTTIDNVGDITLQPTTVTHASPEDNQ